MSSDDNERTTLLSGEPQPSYVFQSNIIHRRQRRVRQFQCCVCAIMLCALVVILVFAVSYGMNQEVELDSSNNSIQNNTELLLTLSWPISDAKQKKLCVDDYCEWQDALVAGSKALHERDLMEKNVPSLDIDNPSYRHQKSFIISNRSRSFSRIQYVKEKAQNYLKSKGSNTTSFDFCNKTFYLWTAELHENNDSIICNKFEKYRSYNGTCNNLRHPTEYGVAFIPFRRALPPDYADGISKPRVARDGTELPSARTVSLVVHRPIYKNDEKFTVMLAVWGQFLDHDITATALTKRTDGKTIACCLEQIHPECFPVKINRDDPYYSAHNITCLEFIRSSATSTNGLGPRQQLNQVTAFLDGSVVYGSHINITRKLRTFQNGKLKMYITTDNRTLLPPSTDPTDGCNREEQNKIGRYCFMTGDQRANENLHLTSMHLIWAREHNRLADEFKNINPHWDDERIFQEARKMLAAEMQHITYNEFLKVLVGPELMRKSDLNPKKTGYYKGYDMNLDVSIANNFATATFRFGHTLIPALVKSLGKNFSNPEYIRFHKILFNPYSLYERDGLDTSLRGAMNTTVEASDTYFNAEVKNHLFEKGVNNSNIVCGLDLVSLNIQRGRDHGIPGYSNWRKHCGLRRPRNFSQLVGDIDDDSLARIQLIYRHVDDIDLYTGAISEKPLDGGMLGPTFTCLILDQFVRLKRGDRMWYENPEQPQAFTRQQLKQIRLVSLARVICDNSDNVDYVQPYVMQRVDESNEYTPCVAIARPDLTKWKDADLPRIRVSDNSISVVPANITFSSGLK